MANTTEVKCIETLTHNDALFDREVLRKLSGFQLTATALTACMDEEFLDAFSADAVIDALGNLRVLGLVRRRGDEYVVTKKGKAVLEVVNTLCAVRSAAETLPGGSL